MFGIGALERALVEMWQRRLELGLLLHIANAFRHSHPHMAQMEVPQIAELAQASKPKAVEAMARIDRELEDRAFIAGDRFSVADITGLVALDFARTARIAIPEEFQQSAAMACRLVGAAERKGVSRARPFRDRGGSRLRLPLRFRVEFGIAPENAHLIKGDPARRSEVGGDARPRHDAIMERDRSRGSWLQRFHAFGKGVAQSFDDSETAKGRRS